MCGILGSLQQPVTPETLQVIAHRGPDYQEIYQWNNVSLGHVRLSIVDLSAAGNQPMHIKDQQNTIIFNGEVYNHLDLRKELGGLSYKGHSDTETILYYLQQKGVEKIHKLNGIFSIALLDKATKKLFLARDPFGVKPLYYHKKGNKVTCFASEIKPLFQLGAPKVFNEEYLTTFLKLRYVPSPYTLFKDIYKVAPGTVLEIDVETGEIIFEHAFHTIPQTNTKINKDEALEQYDYLLRNAVKRQLMADVPVSLLLSGGVDSALIAKLIAENTSEKLQTYTAGYNMLNTDIDETTDAQHTAKYLGLSNKVVTLKEDGFLESLPRLIKSIEEPLGSQSIYPINFLSKKIKEDGFKVTLTGQGVDEPWGGYNRYNTQQLFDKLGGLPLPMIKTLGKHIKNDSLRRGLNTIAQKNRPERFTESYSLFDDSMLQNLLKQDAYKIQDKTFTAHIIMDKINQYQLGSKKATEAMMLLDARMNLSDDLLLYTDKIAMLHSIEMRVPFLDIELMKFVESLPHTMKVGLFKNKWLHKKLAEKHLPKEIIYRKKRGFYMPGKNWFRTSTGVQLEQMLMDDNGLFNTYFDKDEIQKYFVLHRKGALNYEKQLYLLVVLNLWMSAYFE